MSVVPLCWWARRRASLQDKPDDRDTKVPPTFKTEKENALSEFFRQGVLRGIFLNYGAGYRSRLAVGSIQTGGPAFGVKISATAAPPVCPMSSKVAGSMVSTVPLTSVWTTIALLPFHTPPAIAGLAE